MLQCCVCLLSDVVVVCSVIYCGYTVRPRAKVTIDSLYRKSHMRIEKLIGTKMNDDLYLEVVLSSCKPFGFSPLNMSETARDRGLVPKNNNRKWPLGNQIVTWPITSREKSNSWLDTLRAQCLENSWRCYFATVAMPNYERECCVAVGTT